MATATVSVRYDRILVCEECFYIHKYYLPNDLKALFNPADIMAVMRFADNQIKSRLSVYRIPKPIPELTIYYRDINAEKRMSPNQVRVVLKAINAYESDSWASLTAEDEAAASKLNQRLIELEKQIFAECKRLSDDIQKRMANGDPFLTDYEIDVEVSYYLREDDPFWNNEEANEHDVDSDSALVCTVNHRATHLIEDSAAKPDYYGIGDAKIHNYRLGTEVPEPNSNERHCLLFHELYTSKAIPKKHLGRIGRIWADVQVLYQNCIDLAVYSTANEDP